MVKGIKLRLSASARLMIGDGELGGDPFMDEEAREELKRRLEASLSALNAQIEKLRYKYAEMVSRSREYFERVIDALVNKDEGRAAIYAEEIAEVRRLASMVMKTQLVLEQVKLRLETILEISEVIGLVVPLLSLLTEVEDEVAGVVPEAAQSLHELAECIEEFTSSSTQGELSPITMSELDEEAVKILREAQEKAAEKVKSSFPDVPQLTEKERKVYSYVSKKDEIDVYECSKELGIDVEEVKEILEELERKGVIELVGREALGSES